MERKVKYNLAFRHKCVKLVTENHYSISFVAQKFGVNPSQVKRWLQNYFKLGFNGLISLKNKSYTAEFKFRVIAAIERDNLSLSQARLTFNIPSDSMLIQWQRKYATFGFEGLKPKPKGRPRSTMSTYKRKTRKSDKPLTREEELLIENEKLRCQVDFLKKYNALIQAQKEAEAKQKQKSKPFKN